MTTETLTLQLETLEFRADPQARTVSGLLVEWNRVARSGLSLWRFEPGSLRWSAVSRVKLNLHHDRTRPIGVATRLQPTARGLEGTFRIARSEEGDEALQLAKDGVLDGFSIEVDFEESEGDRWEYDPDDRSVRVVKRGKLIGVALCANPAFDNARVEIAASASGTARLPDAYAPAELVDQVRKFAADRNTSVASVIRQAVSEHVGRAYTRQRPVYSMSGSPGDASFVRDSWVIRHPTEGDVFAARERMEAHKRWYQDMAARFASDTTNAAALVEPSYQPLVADITADRPLFAAASKGRILSSTAFLVPGEIPDSSIATAAARHTEGTNPTEGSLTFNGVAVQPRGISGLFRCTRELIDSSNPVIDALALAVMREQYNRETEQMIYEALNAAQAGTITDGRVPSGAQARTSTGQALPVDMRKAAAAFTNVRKQRPRAIVASAQPSVSEVLAEGLDETTGDEEAMWRVMGLPVNLSPAITGTADDDGDVFIIGPDLWCWSSPLLEFQFSERQGPAYVDLCLYGYFACAVTKPAGIASIRHT